MPELRWRQVAHQLPIGEHLPAIARGIADHPLSLLEAPPGSGKTTIIPLALLHEPWLRGKKIIALQPRRLAAKGVATRMAELLGEAVGCTVGYQIRLERCVSPATRIEIITEGLLTRRLISDPELRDVGLVIFDEFHERSIHADVGLVLTREVGAALRDDLKILVMSATLGSLSENSAFSGAWVHTCGGTPHPLRIHHHIPEPRKSSSEVVATAIRSAIAQHDGDILAFLPGVFEIRKCQEILERTALRADILPLYGELPYEEQRRAITRRPDDPRRVVLATPIAETSLTIDGIRVVVDSGLHKIPRSSSLGITALNTERITRDAADQRAGRAARTGPGICIRLWSQQEEATFRPSREPEVLRIDLTATLLDLAVWGVRDFHSFPWITPPPRSAVEMARDLLLQLGALNTDGSVTEVGHAVAHLGTHPRLGVMCLAARRYNLERIAAALIPILEERSLPRSGAGVDIEAVISQLTNASSTRGSSDRLHALFDRWLRRMSALPHIGPELPGEISADDAVGFLLAQAYPERIAMQREPNGVRYLMASGAGATLPEGDRLASNQFLVIAELYDHYGDGRIRQAAGLSSTIIRSHLQHLTSHETISSFDSQRGVLISQRQQRLGALVLSQSPISLDTEDDRRAALLQYLSTEEGFARLPLSSMIDGLRERAIWARSVAPHVNIPDLSSDPLRGSVNTWLGPFLPGDGRLSSVTGTIIESAFAVLVPWESKNVIDSLAPESLVLPNGKTRRIRYSHEEGPSIEAMIQELFGLAETPRIGSQRVAVTLYLLSPARRPMQVTKDLASFWKNGYPAIRKELRGRYPKHRWPEDPLS